MTDYTNEEYPLTCQVATKTIFFLFVTIINFIRFLLGASMRMHNEENGVRATGCHERTCVLRFDRY